jgi:hypothetical protein
MADQPTAIARARRDELDTAHAATAAKPTAARTLASSSGAKPAS